MVWYLLPKCISKLLPSVGQLNQKVFQISILFSVCCVHFSKCKLLCQICMFTFLDGRIKSRLSCVHISERYGLCVEYIIRKKAVLFLMSCFCSHDKLVNMTLSGENGKKAFSKPCFDAILHKCNILIEYWNIVEWGTGLHCALLSYFRRIQFLVSLILCKSKILDLVIKEFVFS